MKRLIAALFIAIMAMTASGCPPELDYSRYEKGMTFFKHRASGLCFAIWDSYIETVTEVPCEKVEHLLVNK